MKILVATKETQGRRANDFCFVPDDEIVYVGMVCDRDRREGPDGGCGCGRALQGEQCLKATTTMKVIDCAMTRENFVAIVADAWVRGGWFKTRELATPFVTSDCDSLLAQARKRDVGTVLEYRAGKFRVRK